MGSNRQAIPDAGVSHSKASRRFYVDHYNLVQLYTIAALNRQNLPVTSRFSARIALYLPEVALQIDDDELGILHLEVGALKLATRDAIRRGDWTSVAKYFVFVADMYEKVGKQLRDALDVSYLGMLLYGETSNNYVKARDLLPTQLAQAYDALERHYVELEHT